MKKFLELFDAIYVINLDSRPDRLNSFMLQMEKLGLSTHDVHSKIHRFSAIVPQNKDGARGCILSHIAILREAMANKYKSILVFEDDAMFVGDDPAQLDVMAEQLSNNHWDMFYLGYNSHSPLYAVSDNLLTIKECYSTHAIAYNSSVYVPVIQGFEGNHIKILDVWLEQNIQKKFTCLGAYPIQFSQIPGVSDIENKVVDYDFIMERFRENTKHLRPVEALSVSAPIPATEEDMLISICMPTYEMRGRGAEFMNESFTKIYNQTYKNVEVIVSDQANDSSIMQICAKWSDRLNVTYVKEQNNRGKSSINMNNALAHAKGQMVKILFQDDFLYLPNALEILVREHKKHNKMWYVSACIHTNADASEFYRPFMPHYHNDIHLGINTMSAPSVITFINSPDYVKFDDQLVWLMDCEYYKRMAVKYGPPHIITDQLVAIRDWDSNYAKLINQQIKTSEYNYVANKHR